MYQENLEQNCRFPFAGGGLRRLLPIALVVSLGVLISFAGYNQVNRYERAATMRDFDEVSTRYATAIQRTIAVNIESIASIKGLFAASREVERQEFHIFTQDRLRELSGRRRPK